MNIYFKLFIYLITLVTFITFIDLSFSHLFYKYIFKQNRIIHSLNKNKRKGNDSTIIYNYYQLMHYCKVFLYDNSIDHNKVLFYIIPSYMCIFFFIYFVIIFIFKYKIIESTKKYNYLYLINAFICCIVFYLYYGSYFYKKVPKLDFLFDKHLTPKEKEIYEKTWGPI